MRIGQDQVATACRQRVGVHGAGTTSVPLDAQSFSGTGDGPASLLAIETSHYLIQKQNLEQMVGRGRFRLFRRFSSG
jgi:hypothetical protein